MEKNSQLRKLDIFSLIDPLIILPIVGLSGISIFLIITSAPFYFWPQMSALLIGLVLYVLFASIDYRIWPKFSIFMYILSLISLIMTFFGPNIRGATRWIDIGITGIQPSEIIKPFMVMFFAYQLVNRKNNKLWSFLKPVVTLLPVIFLIFKQPDLGNVLVFLFIILSIEIASGLSWRYIIYIGVILLVVMPFSWHILKDYQRQRITSFVNPQTDPSGAGYNALQSIIAIGSGQFFGMGLGRGTQSRLNFLPEYHTDFVFASVAESLGFVGGSLIIIFYLLLLGKVLSLALSQEDDYGKLVLIGFFAQFYIQVIINIGMNLGILPITGITLPLVSYGGSSILTTFISLGVLVSIGRSVNKQPLVIR